jgi:cobalamin biosynthesis Mg chelatase CobN
MIPLTLRAMNRTRRPHVRSLARPSVALVSVLALLAFGSFPVLAEANPNYEVEHTTLPEGGGTPTHHKNPGGSESSPEAEKSTAPGGGSNGGGGGGSGQSQTGVSKSHGGAPQESNPGSHGGGGKPQGNSGKEAVGNGKSAGSVQVGEPKSATSDSGSSPLVPILIAVAVLAAISVGAVLVRQRRGSAGGLSPKRG